MANLHIIRFIQSLNSEEIKIVKEYVYKSSNSKDNKIRSLLDVLIDDHEKNISDAQLSKYLQSNAGALRVLKSRLFEKVKEALILNKHFENPAIFNEREKIVFKLKREVLFAKSVFRKLNHDRFETLNLLLKEIIATGTRNQTYDILVEALSLQKYLIGFRNGISSFEQINAKIMFYEKCYSAVQNANTIYYRVTMNQEFNSPSKKEMEQFILQSLKQMKIDYEITKSQEVNYFRHVIQLAYFEIKKDYKSAISCCKKILNMLRKNSILYSSDRIGFMTANLSIFNVYLKNYSKAISISNSGQQFHKPNSTIEVILKEQEFFANYYYGNYETALNHCFDMASRPVKDVGAFRIAKFIYYKACCFFQLKQFKEALKVIKEPLEVEKNNATYNIMLRVLHIMIFTEQSKPNEASRSAVALKKYIERSSKGKDLNDRICSIVKLITELEKDGFNRNNNNKKATKLIEELSDENKPTAWQHFTPELIPFHEWVMTLPLKK